MQMASFKCAVVFSALAIGLIQAGLRVDKEWTDGFQGAIEIPITNAVDNGWELEIRFDRSVTVDAWFGDLKSNVNDQVYTFCNNEWNAQLSSGSQLNFELVVQGTLPSGIMSATFNGQPIDIGSGGGTLPSGTTRNPTGSTPTASSAPITSTVDGKYNYAGDLHASLLFYEAQRAGKLPGDNRISWRGDSMLMDRGENGEDLTGGYFDAGDYVKFGFPMAAFTTLVAWGAIDYEDAYTKAGELEQVRQAIRWSTDYFIKAHVSEREFYGQVGDGYADHASWGRPEDWTSSRPAWKVTAQNPGSDLVGETAAALAAASLVFRSADPAYQSLLLHHAQQLYDFANENRGKYSDSISNAAEFYRSWSGYGDELAWAAAWLLRATGEQRYQSDVERHFNEFDLSRRPEEFGSDNKAAGAQILMAKITQQANYRQQAQDFCDHMVRQAPKTPKGLLFLSQWGALRYAGNVAFVCLQAAEIGINTEEYLNFAARQINYILGDSGRSYLIGFGENYPRQPHHRSSSCPSRPQTCDWNSYSSPQPNPQLLTGALVGGPDQSDTYEDRRDDFTKNEVATDYNAGFQSAVAGLLHFQSK